jgi:hypothetical protein
LQQKGSDTMKLKLAIVAAALALVSASAAQAQLDIVLDSPVQSASSPSFVAFNGTIFNTSDSATITIDGDSVSAPDGVGVDLPHSDLIIGSWPVTLGPGDSFRGDWLFGLDIPASQTESFGGTYAVTGTDAMGAPVAFSADYRINLQGAPVVPEPGTMALLASGLVGGSLLMKRRRK